MGSLSDLRRSYVRKEFSADGTRYRPYENPALAGGAVVGGAGGLALVASRRMPERAQAARDRVAANTATLEAQEARMAQKGGRKARQATRWADAGRARLAHADRVASIAPTVQRSLRTKGGLMAAAGASLAAYGAYAKLGNKQQGYS